jgi:hypothetical protein
MARQPQPPQTSNRAQLIAQAWHRRVVSASITHQFKLVDGSQDVRAPGQPIAPEETQDKPT